MKESIVRVINIEKRKWRRFEEETNEGHRHYLKMYGQVNVWCKVEKS